MGEPALRFQLVVQFDYSSVSDRAFLLRFEEDLRKQIEGHSEVDGHDFGSGEMNIFIFTDEPQQVCAFVIEAARKVAKTPPMRMAYRLLQADEYEVLWPPELTTFTVG